MPPPGLAEACSTNTTNICTKDGSIESKDLSCVINVKLVDIWENCNEELHWTGTFSYDASHETGCRNCCYAIGATNDYTEFCETGRGGDLPGTVYSYCKEYCVDIPMEPPGLTSACDDHKNV